MTEPSASSPARLPISACLIAGNEAGRIRRTLESMVGWVSEMVVVINEEVADGTDRIAVEFGAKVFREPWKGYVAQVNSAAAKAGQPWILAVDADEVVSPELAAEIRGQFARPEGLAPYAAFSFPRCSFYCGRWIRHGDWYPDRKTRLWRRGAGHWVGENPHYALVITGRTEALRGELQHYSMDSLDHHVRKMLTYSELYRERHGDQSPGLAALWFRPWWRFVRGYVLRRGFLDGWQGFVIARMVAFETFLRQAKIRAGRTAVAKE